MLNAANVSLRVLRGSSLGRCERRQKKIQFCVSKNVCSSMMFCFSSYNSFKTADLQIKFTKCSFGFSFLQSLHRNVLETIAFQRQNHIS